MVNPMQEARKALRHHPRCGAYARTTGEKCKGWAMSNGRCRMHGGKAGRPPTHGRYTKQALQERKEVRDMIKALRELLG
jgi:hypothetical protein